MTNKILLLPGHGDERRALAEIGREGVQAYSLRGVAHEFLRMVDET